MSTFEGPAVPTPSLHPELHDGNYNPDGLRRDLPGWMDDARCLDADLNIFFPEQGGSPPTRQTAVQRLPRPHRLPQLRPRDPVIPRLWHLGRHHRTRTQTPPPTATSPARPPTGGLVNADDVLEALARRYSTRKGWVHVTEVCQSTGRVLHLDDEWLNASRRIDFFALNTWPSQHHERVAVEVKVSRSDFLRELDEPRKRRGAELLSHRFYFATPAGLVLPREVPDGCGLLEVNGAGTRIAKQATRRDPHDMPVGFVASLLRVASEQRTVDRCGAAGCLGPPTVVRWLGKRWEGVKVHLCDRHLETLEPPQPAAVQPELAQEREAS